MSDPRKEFEIAKKELEAAQHKMYVMQTNQYAAQCGVAGTAFQPGDLREQLEKASAEVFNEPFALTNDDKIIKGARLILEGLGVDLSDHNFKTTPERVLKVYKEIFSPPDTEWPVFEENYTDIVVMRNATFSTFCPHHMLPVKINFSVAYLPNGAVIGASKLVRMAYDANRKPMTQEALTAAISERIDSLTQGRNRGTAVWLVGEHGCFSMRGVKQPCANMVTVKFTGDFQAHQSLRDQFFHLVK